MWKFQDLSEPGTPSIWFTSDSHYNHKNICSGTSSWEVKAETGQRTRNFDTLREMNDAIINGINNNVDKHDILFHLGDWSFGGFDSIEEFRASIACKNIHLIYGNHDHHIENDRGRVQNFFRSCKYYNEVAINNQMIVMAHYAFRVWNKSHHGSWNLYGHSHDTLDHTEHGKSMDVGIDSAYRIFGEYRPFNFKEIKTIMDSRATKIIDHHNEKTN